MASSSKDEAGAVAKKERPPDANPFTSFITSASPAATSAAPQGAVLYICGNCGADVDLKPGDAVRCRECGYRILFKKRAKKPMQFQAI
mmetsp:Transcript_57317/g.136246  ORF Transcript_57317/g.136246 Transcript_57317/m.136246 type:complete len:88 (-) Transcript_57317:177-440(-)